jgi:hypothetical protein
VSATTASSTSIALTWTASTTPGVSYGIFRGTAPSFAPNASNNVGGTTSASFTDTGLSPSTTYYYYVLATDSGGISPNSNEASATTSPSTGGQQYPAVNAVASSVEDSSFPAAGAIDNNLGTRWSSAFSDPQWIYVDLGSVKPIGKVVLSWETAAAKAYMLQTSPDAVNWTTIFGESNGQGGTETLNVFGSGRYVRMYGTQRTTGYGYSLWEFQVFAPASGVTEDVLLASSATGSSGVLNQGNQQILTAAGQTLCWNNVGMGGVTTASVTLGNGQPPGNQLLVLFNGAQIGSIAIPHTDNPWTADTQESTSVTRESGSGTLCLGGSGSNWIASVSQIVLVQ